MRPHDVLPALRPCAAMPASHTTVVVAIPTLCRPQMLWDVLAHLGTLERPDGVAVRFLVVDNSADADWDVLVAEAARAGGIAIAFRHEPQRGLAAVRNRALAEAEALGAGIVFFLDDDQTPERSVLVELYAALRRHDAQAVFGAVRARYCGRAPRWMHRGRFHDGPPHDDGETLDYADTSNVMFDLDFARRNGIRFEHDFNRTGGEDTLFFRTLHRQGGKIVYCPDGVLYENIVGSRARLAWLLRRWRWTGNTCGRIELRLGGGRRRALLAAGGLARVGCGALLAVLAIPAACLGRFDHMAEHLRVVARGVGFVEAAFGRKNFIFERADH